MNLEVKQLYAGDNQNPIPYVPVTHVNAVLDDNGNSVVPEVLPFNGFISASITASQTIPESIDGIVFYDGDDLEVANCFYAYKDVEGTVTYYTTWDNSEQYNLLNTTTPLQNKIYLYNDAAYIIHKNAISNPIQYDLRKVFANGKFITGEKVNDISIATSEDFDNPTDEQKLYLATVGAILDGADDEPTRRSNKLVKSGGVVNKLATKQDILVSGRNIKTINGNNILGSGNINIGGSGGGASTFAELTGNPMDNADLANLFNSCFNSIGELSSRINDVIGASFEGINMTVTPTHFSSLDGADIIIEASCSGDVDIFESIAFYANNELIAQYTNVDSVSTSTHITVDTEIKCVAQILGTQYVQTQMVDKVTSFYIGGGNDADEIIDDEHRVDIIDTIEGLYTVELAQNDHLLIVMDSTYASEFNRADMNGFEIPMSQSTVTYGSIEYTVYKSDNIYQSGEYDIYINR